MATVLPALSRDKQKSSSMLPGLAVPRSGKARAPKIQKGARPSVGKLAGIEKADVSQFRNTYKHNLSIEILQEGYVSSFIELFELFDKQSEDRKKAGSESGVHEVPLLIDEHEKLDMLKSKLIEAEEARRTGEPDKSYMAFLDLAHYFEQFPADEWLIDNFHSQCMSESLRVAGDGGRKQAEANFNIGVALEKRGDLSSAVEYLETFYTLSMEQEWQDKIGDSLHDQACLQLYKTYTCLAEEIYEASPTGAIDYLKKAYSMAKEGGDRQEEGVASHRLGNAYEAVGDPEVATMYHKGFLERCKRDKDRLGIGRAHEALARCYQSEGKLELAAENYKEFVKIAEESGDEAIVSQASSSLATLYNMLGEYTLAVEYYAKAGATASNLDSERMELMNINQAISQSHHKLSSYSTTILPNTYRLNSSLVEWKDYRDESFIGLSRPETRNDSEIPPSGTPVNEPPAEEGHATPK